MVAISDGTGRVIEKIWYDVYGRITDFHWWNGSGFSSAPKTDGFVTAAEYSACSLTKNPRLFQGRDLDEESGLYYFKNRYYDPTHGRFISRDPAGYADSYCLYQFCNNNPVCCYVDPIGLYGEETHRRLTRYLAELAGFSSGDATILGDLDQGVDDPSKDAFGAAIDHIANYKDYMVTKAAYDVALSNYGAAKAEESAVAAMSTYWWYERRLRELAQAHALISVLAAEGVLSIAKAAFAPFDAIETKAFERSWMHFPRTRDGVTIRSGAAGNVVDVEVETAIKGTSFNRFGELLHTVQDSFAHEGGTWTHPAPYELSHAPDIPAKFPTKAGEMARRTLEFLLEYQKASGAPCVSDVKTLWTKTVHSDVEKILGTSLPAWP